MTAKPHIVLICPEPIRRLQQGVGIRFREMARELSREYRVSVWAQRTDDFDSPEFTVQPFPDRALAEALVDVRAVVVHGHISERYFEQLAAAGLDGGPPLVVDLYDPFLVENLHYTRDLGDEIYSRDLAVLVRQLSAGDLFLVSSDSQRLFYVGLMMASGLFTPAMYHADPTLAQLFALAPFGVPSTLPEPTPAASGWKSVVPGIAASDHVIFFGGIYDWYDPELLLDAAEGLLTDFPNLRIVFSANPNPESTPQAVYERTRARAETGGLLDKAVFFVPWFPFDERSTYLRDVDIAVCLHRPSLEADLSLRTRLLDFMQAGIPIIASSGGETASILTASGAGSLVAAGDVAALKRTIADLLTHHDQRARMGTAGREWVHRERTWTRTLEPLFRFCAKPRKRAFQNASLMHGSSPRAERKPTRVSYSRNGHPEFTVIVPTHNRKRLLAEVLTALEAQADAPSFEIVVVDDGSRDGTSGWLAHRSGNHVRVLTLPHRGVATARNAGIRAARGRYVAFLGDDTVPEPRWLAHHHAAHRAAGDDPLFAVIGHVAWHQRVKVTPFLECINGQGKQFGYALIEDPRDLPFNFFYGSNASLYRETAESELFDERFPYAAWEDTEFAYRLKRRGLHIDYEASARVAHDHPTSIGRFLKRQERVGYAAVIFHERHPELGPWLGLSPDGPPPLERTPRERMIELRVRALDRLGISSPEHWDEMMRLSYLSGLHRGWRTLRRRTEVAADLGVPR